MDGNHLMVLAAEMSRKDVHRLQDAEEQVGLVLATGTHSDVREHTQQ